MMMYSYQLAEILSELVDTDSRWQMGKDRLGYLFCLSPCLSTKNPQTLNLKPHLKPHLNPTVTPKPLTHLALEEFMQQALHGFFNSFYKLVVF